MRDCLVFEDGQRLVLLAGIPRHWFEQSEEIAVEDLGTYFGACSFPTTMTHKRVCFESQEAHLRRVDLFYAGREP